MAKKKTTKEFMNGYFDSIPPNKRAKIRGQIDRDEVYEYEEKIGKQIFDMSIDELFEMMKTFKNNRFKSGNGKDYSIPYNTYLMMTSLFRGLFNYYIDDDDGRIIKNPFNSPEMRGQNGLDRICSGETVVTKENFDKAIGRLHATQEHDFANYIECILRMYYEGFFNASCIVNLKEEDIDFDTNEIYIHDEYRGGKIKVSDRLCELLRKVHSFKEVSWAAPRLKCGFAYYRGGYIPFAIKEKDIPAFDSRPEIELTRIVNRYIVTVVNKELGYQFNYRNIYLLGFYDFLVNNVGKEHTTELIRSVRSPELTEEMRQHIKEYGLYFYYDPSAAKRALKIFV